MDGQAQQFALPIALENRSVKIGKWMKLVGMFQLVGAGFCLLFFGWPFLAGLMSFEPIIMLTSVLLLGCILVPLFQGLKLVAAAEHFQEAVSDPEEAYDHLTIAFQRLKTVFVIDAVLAGLWLSFLLLGFMTATARY